MQSAWAEVGIDLTRYSRAVCAARIPRLYGDRSNYDGGGHGGFPSEHGYEGLFRMSRIATGSRIGLDWTSP